MNNGKICVSVCAATADEFIADIRRAEELADVIELRFDKLDAEQFELFLVALKELKPTINKPFLAAMHDTVQKFTVDDLQLPQNFEVWEQILASDAIDFIDPFQGGILAMLIEDWNNVENLPPHYRPFIENARKHALICSFHDFEGVPDDLESKYEWMKETPASVIKIAVTAADLPDSIAIWKILERAASENKSFIPIAMGAAGKWTRILGLAHGAFMTYASLDACRETAPGQVTAKELIEDYRARELDDKTEVYGILGHPVAHSVSPEMHNAAFKFHDLNAVYIPFEVNNLDEFIARMVKPETREIDLNFKGFSVTIPHKQAIIKHLDFIDPTAKEIGAVNTVKIVDGRLHGYNTDAEGFIEPLKQTYGDLKDANVAIFGAGGSARACVYALKQAGAVITIFARNSDKARTFADEFNIDFDEFLIDDQSPRTRNFDILVNTTPLGMTGRFENRTPARAHQIEKIKLVYDLVFNPLETRLMKEADKVNVAKIGGAAMLVAQGAAQFKIWTGKDAPVKEMTEAVLKKLG